MKNEHEINIEASENSIAFKKVLRGFDPDEVIAYIDEMNRTMQDASKNYETRMAEMKQELTLVSRERDNLRKQCSELEQNAETPFVPQVEEVKAEDGEKEAQSLKAELEKERSANTKSEKALENANGQIKELSSQLKSMEKQLSDCYKRIDEQEKKDRTEPFREQYEEAVKQIEKLKSNADSLREKNEQLNAEASATTEHIRKIEDENTDIKTELSRISVENDLLKEKNGQYKKELSEMKADAKKKAYSYAEKLAAGEDELNKEKMKLEKKLQMQSYHIEQANSAIDELKKQLEQISLSSGD